MYFICINVQSIILGKFTTCTCASQPADLTPYQRYLNGHRDELLKAITPDAYDILDDVRTVLNMHQIDIDKRSTSKRETAAQIVDILIHHGDKAKQFLGSFDHKKKNKKVSSVIKAALKEEEKENKEISTTTEGI